MHNIWMIVRREYRERVTKKSFWIGTAVFPVLMGGLIIGSILLAGMQTDKERKIAIVDATGAVAPAVVQKLSAEKLKDGKPKWIVEAAPVVESVDATISTFLNTCRIAGAWPTISPKLRSTFNSSCR